MIQLRDTAIGLEFGSTRIKAVLIDMKHRVLSSGSHEWENRLENGIWTYSMDDIVTGLQNCFADLKRDFQSKFGQTLSTTGAMGISAMMHGYLPTDADGDQLTEFRTWRNTITAEAAERLTEAFQFNIPQRWSIAHLYRAMLLKEDHLPRLAHLNTLAVYIHEKLTGNFVAGIGEASGMFPVDRLTGDYDKKCASVFEELAGEAGYPFRLTDILPRVLRAGENAGCLTEAGARLLDPAGDLCPGIPFCPPEGDAGTGMTATNSVAARTGNVSAGTSDFAMIVLEKPIGLHREIGVVATPDGLPVAMVHCSNCTSDINAWAGLFMDFAEKAGLAIDKNRLYTILFQAALEGERDCGGLINFNYYSGEAVTGFNEGRPVFSRRPDAKLSLPNFMRTQLLSALATLKIGLDILKNEEQVPIDRLYGHGGFFKTPLVGQRLLSAAVGAPVSVMAETAGEGGPYGMALLCAYMLWRDDGQSLPDYLEKKVFHDVTSSVVMADPDEIKGFNTFLRRYRDALPLEAAAVECV